MLILLVIVIFIVLSILALIYFYLIDNYDHWSRMQVDQIGSSETWPGLGNVHQLFGLRESLTNTLYRLHIRHSGRGNARSMLGFYFLRQPALLLRDPRLIRRVLLTQRRSFGPFAQPQEKLDSLLTESSLFVGCDSFERHRLRVKFTTQRLSRVFSGMCYLSNDTCVAFEKQFEWALEDDGAYHQIDPRHWMTFFSTTVMLQYGLGEADLDSVNGRQLKRVGFRLHKFLEGPRQLFQHVYSRYAPWLSNKLGGINQSIVPEKTERLFREVIIEYLNTYKSDPNSLQSDSLLNWMHLDLEETNRSLLDDETIIRQLFAFYLEVYLINAVIGSFVLFHLSWKPSIQTRLRREIITINKLSSGKGLTYDDLAKMPYLDAVINETMRMHPVPGAIERICQRDIEMKGIDGQYVYLKPGDPVFVSSLGLHLDWRLWRSPRQFDPTRFLTCDGMRVRSNLPLIPFIGLHTSRAVEFHWMSLRLLLINIIYKFELSKSPDMKSFPKPCEKSFIASVKDGLWIRMRKVGGGKSNNSAVTRF